MEPGEERFHPGAGALAHAEPLVITVVTGIAGPGGPWESHWNANEPFFLFLLASPGPVLLQL